MSTGNGHKEARGNGQDAARTARRPVTGAGPLDSSLEMASIRRFEKRAFRPCPLQPGRQRAGCRAAVPS